MDLLKTFEGMQQKKMSVGECVIPKLSLIERKKKSRAWHDGSAGEGACYQARVQSLRATWWEEKTDFCTFSSDFYICAGCEGTHTHTNTDTHTDRHTCISHTHRHTHTQTQPQTQIPHMHTSQSELLKMEL
jgi:hypothetical protein